MTGGKKRETRKADLILQPLSSLYSAYYEKVVVVKIISYMYLNMIFL